MRPEQDPGLGKKFNKPVPRFLNPDGTYNINRHGVDRGIRDLYKYLIDISWWSLLGYLLAVFIMINLLFACLYSLMNSPFGHVTDDHTKFWNAFFFSTQTFTTLGYGALAPQTWISNLLAGIEAFLGLLFFAIATGLLYGRFSKSNSKISFSDKILLRPFEGTRAIMFKMVNQRDNVLLKTKVSCTLILNDENSGGLNKKYHRLDLVNDFVLFFPLTWTLVHKMDESSPLHTMTFQELTSRKAELVVFVETYDETYGHSITQKHSYAGDQWLEKFKFDMNFSPNESGQIDLYLNQLNNISPIEESDQH